MIAALILIIFIGGYYVFVGKLIGMVVGILIPVVVILIKRAKIRRAQRMIEKQNEPKYDTDTTGVTWDTREKKGDKGINWNANEKKDETGGWRMG